MKKLTTLMLVLSMLASAAIMSACGGNEPVEDSNPVSSDATVTDTENTDDNAGDTSAEEEEVVEEQPVEDAVTEPVEEEPAEEQPAEEEAAPVEEDEPTEIFEQMDTWHYITHYCPYTDGNGTVGGSTAGGFFDEASDEMAMYVAEHPEWYKDTELMASWDEADAPFGNCISSDIAADTDFLNDTNTNGLMVYKTFTVDSISEADLYEMYCFYDNTVYIYVNGELYYVSDANCGSGDWNGAYDLINCNTAEDKTLRDFLVEGENYIAVSIKNCWGGREFDMYLTCEKNSTKRDTLYFERGSEWHYSVFACPYTDGEGNIDGGTAGGFFDEATDEMAAFIAENPNFMTDTELLSSWDTANGAFGNIMEDIGWTGSNHGLILYKTFTVEDLNDALTCDSFIWNCAYDNAIHTYLNGTEVYVDDGECVATDWADGEWVLDKDLVSSLLVEGENYFVVTIKDAWGGRNFDAGFSAHWN